MIVVVNDGRQFFLNLNRHFLITIFRFTLTPLRQEILHSFCQERPFPRAESHSTNKDSSPKERAEVDSEVVEAVQEAHQEELQEVELEVSVAAEVVEEEPQEVEVSEKLRN